jgi:heme/copper-type cytochrome/quinol oxidase subunit 2
MSRATRQRVRACHRPAERGARFRARVTIFAVLTIATIVAAGILLWPRGTSAGPADSTVQITMGGFSTPTIEAKARHPLRLRIDNPDSSFHTDGGGWHQLAIPALGVDARIAPRSDKVVEIPAAEPGEYAFYCDICCGGKDNPSMQGVLRVAA